MTTPAPTALSAITKATAPALPSDYFPGDTAGPLTQTWTRDQVNESSSTVYYASRNGCVCNANLNDASVGADDSAALQALIDATATTGTRTVIVIDGPMKVGNVKLRSGITLRGLGGGSYGTTFPRSGLIQAPNTFCCLRNFNWTSNYNNGSPVTDYSTIVDENITIRDLFINGNRGTGTVNNANGGNTDIRFLANDGYVSPSKIGISPLMFFGVRNLHVENVFCYDPATSVFLGAYLDTFTIKKIRVVVPAVYNGRASPTTLTAQAMSPTNLTPTGGNMFGAVSLSGNVRSGMVDDVSGYYNGTLVAVQTDWIIDRNYANGPAAYLPILYPGPATDIQISRLRGDLVAAFVALWSGGHNNTNSLVFQSLIDRISCQSAIGTTYQGWIFLDGPTAQQGIHGSERFVDFSVTFQCGTYGFMPVWIEGTHTDLRFQDVRFEVAAATTAGVPGFAVGCFWINSTGNGSIDISNVHVYDVTTSLLYDCIYLNGASTVTELKIHNCTFYRTATASGAFYHNAGTGSATNVQISGLFLSNVAHALLLDGGSPSSVTTSGLTHLNANGNASIVVSAVTLARLRCSGSNTAILASTINAGVITSKKTDLTEDS